MATSKRVRMCGMGRGKEHRLFFSFVVLCVAMSLCVDLPKVRNENANNTLQQQQNIHFE
jgi:hypothetical protein